MERAGYRIIDANFNRAREALRVIEEYCRFALDSEVLTERAKQLRHELSAAIDELDAGRLISSRDTLSDVGVGKKVDKQLERSDLNDCFTAACKRLTEALRVIAEVTQTDNNSLAETFEKLRFSAYKLEKDIVLFSQPTEKFKRIQLYVIISSNLPADIMSLTSKLAHAGADCIQLRAKDIDDKKLFAVAKEFAQICKDAGVLSIINDRADIAAVSGADGVHLGQDDLPIEQVRKLELSPMIIGTSTHSLKELNAACEQLPTYVSLGPVFASPTKPEVGSVGLEYVKEGTEKLTKTGIGHVAIGGITMENVKQVLQAGARTIAACSAVSQTSDPAQACRALKEIITTYKED